METESPKKENSQENFGKSVEMEASNNITEKFDIISKFKNFKLHNESNLQNSNEHPPEDNPNYKKSELTKQDAIQDNETFVAEYESNNKTLSKNNNYNIVIVD